MTAQIEDCLGRGELDAAEQGLTSGEQEFGALPVWTQLRDRLTALREQARREQLPVERLEQPRREADTPTPEPGRVDEKASLEAQPDPPPPSLPDVGVAVQSLGRGWSPLESRGLQAALALLILLAGTWSVLLRPVQPIQSTQPAESGSPSSSAPATAGLPAPSRISKPTEPEVLPSTGRDIFLPASPAVTDDTPEVSTAKEPATTPPVNVDDVRARARSQRQSGDHVQALKTVVEGLRLVPTDAGLKGILTSLLGDARSSAARSKQEAINLEARDLAAEPFAQGVRSESEATRLQRSGQIDAAVRAWWTATDRFKAASAHARQLADEEAEEQKRIDQKAGQRHDQAPQRADPPPRPTERSLPDSGIEQNLVNATLRRFEAAYGSLSAEAVRQVYPTAPVDQLTREFAGCQSYIVRIKVADYNFLYTDTLWIATVPATVSYEITPKSGQPTRVERSQTFQLVKQGNSWVIRQIR